MQFAITIDTEVDKSPNWSVSNPVTWDGVFEGVFRRLHPLFERHAIRPVYFLSNEVIANEECAQLFVSLNERGAAELATHLHYEAAGPLSLPDIAGRHLAGIQAELPAADERRALEALTHAFAERFGKSPVSFRAGRFGIGPATGGILASLGYKVDSSVTPLLRWDFSHRKPGLEHDCRRSPARPYFADPDNLCRPGAGPILEIPLSIDPAPMTGREILRRLAGRPKRHLWLRPRFASGPEMRRMVEKRARMATEHTIMVMMFHNMEVVPGKSPYCQSESEVEEFLAQIEEFILAAKRVGATSTTFADYVAQTTTLFHQ